MKKSFLFFFFFILLFACKNDSPSPIVIDETDIQTDSLSLEIENHENEPIIIETSDSILGDFDGDGVEEYMWVEKPQFPTGDGYGECIEKCECYIKFSSMNIPIIQVETCIGGTPDNLGDLNGNGVDEIGLLPQWWQSCWKAYYVWTFVDNEWQYAVDPLSTHCVQHDEGIFPIEKDTEQDGNVIIYFSEMTDDSIEIVSKSIEILR